MKRRASLQLVPNSSKKSNSHINTKLFEKVVCLVETFNEDGTDASSEYIRILRSHGAVVKDSLSEGLTHFIVSNPTSNRPLAASILNIHCISPLWIEQCREANKLVTEKDFLYSMNPIVNKVNVTSSSKSTSEPKPNMTKEKRNVDSPFFNSSQREIIPITKNKKKPISKPTASPSNRSVISEEDDFDPTEDNKLNAIPLPNYKPYVPPFIPDSLPRRSERILDNSTDDLSHSFSPIDPQAPIPVISNDVWPPSDKELANKLKSNKSKKTIKKSDKVLEKSIHKNNSISTSNNINNDDIVIALTSFNDSEGEKTTLIALITALIKLIKNVNPSYNVRLLKDMEDIECRQCTHIIAPAVPMRTLRIIFAIARGIPILTVEWLYECLQEENWVDNPKPNVIKDLIETVGGTVTMKLDKANYLILGDQSCANEWIEFLCNDVDKLSLANKLEKSKRVLSVKNDILNVSDIDNDVILSFPKPKPINKKANITVVNNKSIKDKVTDNKTDRKNTAKSSSNKYDSEEEWNDDNEVFKSPLKPISNVTNNSKSTENTNNNTKNNDTTSKVVSTVRNKKKIPLNSQSRNQEFSQSTNLVINSLIKLADKENIGNVRKSPRSKSNEKSIDLISSTSSASTIKKGKKSNYLLEDISNISAISKVSNNKLSLNSPLGRISRSQSPTW
eukprot:gene18903-24704_t